MFENRGRGGRARFWYGSQRCDERGRGGGEKTS